MKTKYFSLLLIFSTSLLWGASAASAAERDYLAEIDALLRHGKSEFHSCNKFKKKWKKNVVMGGLQSDSPSHTSKKQALDALSLLEKKPGWAPSYAKASELYFKNIAELSKLPNQAALLEKYSQIEPECEIFSTLTHTTLLFKDVDALEFSKKETERVKRFAKKYFAQDYPFLSLLMAGIKGNLLHRYLETVYEGEDKEELVKKAQAYLDKFEAKRVGLVERMKQIKFTSTRNTVEPLGLEWETIQEMSSAYGDLIKDVKL
jgi:hypothetical protein